jgi:hypothetical protein
MLTRRQTVVGAVSGAALPTLSTLLTLPALVACAPNASHEEAARSIWRHGSESERANITDRAGLLRELVRYATLAPSSHNTQCWKFRIDERAIGIEPDFSRRCPAVDPDDHHLFVSLGCAAENLAQAALAHGLKAEAATASGAGGITLNLEPTRALASPLFQAIVERQSTRGEYDGKPLTADELRLLAQAGTGAGVRVMLMTERPAMDKVLEYVASGNSAQMKDAAFVAELKDWIRFSADQAVTSGDGLYSAASGNPSLPPWLGRPLMNVFFTEKSENDKYANHVRSSAGVAIFVSEANDKAHWMETGRCYERFALQAAALGIRNALLNQPVEVVAIRPQFAAWLGVGALRPDLVVRFGRGPKMPQSLRRPVQAVLI